jgi:hypothetical protein
MQPGWLDAAVTEHVGYITRCRLLSTHTVALAAIQTAGLAAAGAADAAAAAVAAVDV